MMQDTAAHAYDNYKGLTGRNRKSWILEHSCFVWGFLTLSHNIFSEFLPWFVEISQGHLWVMFFMTFGRWITHIITLFNMG